MAGKNVVDIVLDFKSKGSSYLKSIIKDIAKITSAMEQADKASSNMSSGMSSDSKKVKASFKSTDSSVEKLTSSIEKMTKEMQQYKSTAGTVTKVNSGATDSFGRLGGAIALAFGGAAVAGSVSQTNEDILLLSNRAKLLEMQMSDLAAMQKVAFNVGNIPDFEEGLKNLSQRIYDLKKNGGGEGMEVFQQLKLDLDAIYAMPIDEQFYAIADAMAEAGYSVQDMYGAFDQLGSDQLGDLAHYLENGSEEMRKAVKRTKELDSALSEVDYKKLEILARETNKVGQNVDNTSKKLTSEMSPAIIGVVGGFDELLKIVGKNKNAMHGVFKAGLVVGTVFVQLSQKIGASFKTILASFAIAFLEVKVLMNELSNSLHESYAGFFDTVYEKIWWLKKETLEMFGTLSDSAKKAAEEMGDTYTGGEVNIQVGINKKQIKEDKQLIETLKDSFKDQGDILFKPFDVTTVLDNYDKQQKAYDDLAESVADNEAAQAKLSKTTTGTANNSLEMLEAQIAAEELLLDAKLKANKAKIDADLEVEKERYKIAKLGIETNKKLGKISADEALRLKLKADKEYADNAAKLLQEKLDLEIELEEKKIKNLQKLKKKSASDTDRTSFDGEIKAAEVELNELRKERNAITAESLQLSKLDEETLKAQVELEKFRAKQKDESKAKTEEERRIEKEKTEELEKQREIRERMQDVYSAHLVAEGRELDNSLNSIDRKYQWLLDNLEKGSEDLKLVEKLIDIEKAEVQIDELSKKLGDISYSYNSGDISQNEYENQTMSVLGQMGEIAEASNSVALMNDVTKATRDAAKAFDELYQVGEMVGSSLSASFSSAFGSIIDGSKSASEAFRDLILDMTKQIIDMMINQMIQQFMSSMFSGMGGGGGFAGGIAAGVGSAGISSFSSTAIQRHDGGSVSKYGGVTRQLNPAIAAMAAQFSTGSGLSSNEVVAVLERDEKVLTKEQQRREQQSQSSAAGSISIVNALDSESIANALDTPAGHKVIENKIRAMRNEIKSF
ncbi:hypothetical protein [Vibrio parahaemolyticus]|uniref:hypothetical protein n=1 Tax=Vibrio parahaemolyticus TaxID=670 RepID=UPI0004530055|nr:hypothetical protein [Vibrio parahaemolyticus]ETZ12200.1 hypothetical protein AJ90_24570 [Vibrio parahaemolyticus M0605]MBD6964857.1 hypothetical protein [Vibrio parahaemolyticus]